MPLFTELLRVKRFLLTTRGTNLAAVSQACHVSGTTLSMRLNSLKWCALLVAKVITSSHLQHSDNNRQTIPALFHQVWYGIVVFKMPPDWCKTGFKPNNAAPNLQPKNL